ncbi:MAG: ABC transporter permease [Polyangiaceae bacterium]|nr:ABC transporter permease [Polyangiaceae bacterium]
MRALDKKLWRELYALKAQAFTIALVVACGIAGIVALQSDAYSIATSRDRYYASHRFADVFATLKRAPEEVAGRLESVPGVNVVETRLSESVLLPLPWLDEPAVGQIVSLPPHGAEPRLNAIYLREGRLPEPGRPDEVLVHESFAKAQKLRPGDPLPAVLNGVLRELRVVGVALSPEFVFPVGSGGILTDDQRFGILWMDRDVLGDAFQMQGAFNDVVVSLRPGTAAAGVVDALDRELAAYGGLGARARDKQASNQVLDGELGQLSSMASVVPVIFLAVAAFLINVVLGRIVQLQRGEIATLKAVGYGDRQVGWHFLELVGAIALIGAALGFGLGAWLGSAMLELYRPYFQFPTFDFVLDLGALGTSVAASLAAALVGGYAAARRVSRLPPAEAMQPEAPASYRRGWLEALGLGKLLPATWKMVIRTVVRRPLRAGLAAIGIAFALATVVTARFGTDAFEMLIELEFHEARRDDLTVAYRMPLGPEAARELAHLPGVLAAEPERVVGVRMRVGPRWRDVPLVGHAEGETLRRIVEWPRATVSVPPEGVVLTAKLAEVLGVAPGDQVSVEVLEGDRRVRLVPVTGLASEVLGLNGHMDMGALNALLGEERGVASGARLRVDPVTLADVERRLADMPKVAALMRRQSFIDRLRQQTGESTGTTTLILTLFGVTLAVGVVYNQARIALSTRSRELASLRVLGFTRAEVTGVLLGELGLQVAVALPLGMVLGAWLSQLIMTMVDQEQFRFPSATSAATYAFAAVVTVAAAVASAAGVKRRLDRIDLVSALKTRE